MKWNWLWRVFVGSVACMTGWIIYRSLVLPASAFRWDEAAHSLRALQIAEDVRNGHWIAFLFDTYRQVYWPPLHSWFCAAAFLISGPTATAARSVSVLFFVATALIVYVAAAQTSNVRKDVAATIATILFLGSPLAVSMSAQAMLEIPGLFFFSLCLLIYFWLRLRPRPPSAHLWLGIAFTLTYFTRTNYAVLLLIVFVVVVLLEARFESRPIFSAANCYTILPLVVSLVIWFAYPPKIQSTWAALVGARFGPKDTYGWDGLLFYPRVVLHLSGSVWRSAVLVIAFFAALRDRKNPAIRFLLLLAAVQLILGVLHHTRDDRLILPIVVPLVILTGFVIAQWWDASTTGTRWLVRSAALLLCLSAPVSLYFYPFWLGPQAYPEVSSRIAELATTADRSLLLGTRKITPSPPLLDWQLAVEKKIVPINASGVIIDIEEYQKFERALPHLPLPGSLKITLEQILREPDKPVKLRSLYPDVSLSAFYSASPKKFEEVVRRLGEANSFDQILLLTPLETTLGKTPEFFAPGISALNLNHAFTETFPSSKLQLDVYRTIASPQ